MNIKVEKYNISLRVVELMNDTFSIEVYHKGVMIQDVQINQDGTIKLVFGK